MSQRRLTNLLQRIADDLADALQHGGDIPRIEGQAALARVWAAIRDLPVTRIGHGVRSAEDPALVAELARRGVVLEVCPGSNVALGLYPDRASHPLHRLIDAGVRVTLNSDDPPFFHTTLGTEYDLAGLDEAALKHIARTTVEASFADEATRQKLLREMKP